MTGIALLLLGAAGVVTVDTLERPARATVVGGNFPVNAGASDPRDLTAHNSPSLVANPANAANLAIANRIDTPRFSCALHVSHDGGAAWSQTPIPIPEGEEPKCLAPDAAFGIDGVLYVSFVTLKGDGNVPSGAWVALSRDGGRTVSAPTRVAGPLAFQVGVAADPSVPGRLYVTWLQATHTAALGFPETGYPVSIARSDDGGATWQGPARVSPLSRDRVVAPSLAVGRAGELYVAYLDLGDDRLDYEGAHGGLGGEPYPGRWRLVVARSADGAATWQESVAEPDLVPTERFVVFNPPFPSVAVDRGTGRVYVSFADGRRGDADVVVWSSEDGEGWSEGRRVNDTPSDDGTAQYLPRVAVGSGGRLDVVYYDRRADPGNVFNEVSLQSSFDGGRSFTPRLVLTDRPFDSRIGFGNERGLPELGTRLGLVSTDARVLAVWTDTRAGTDASRKQDLVRALVAIAGPGGPPAWARAALRGGGAALSLLGLVVLASLFRRRSTGPGPF